MAANLPVAFGALLVGGLLVDKGVQATRQAFDSTPAAGSTGSTASPVTGAGTTQPTSGPAAAQQMLAAAQAAVGGPYSMAEHAAAFGKAGSWLKQFGTDCSGFVSYLMGVAGFWHTSYTTDGIPSAPNLAAGSGTYVTLWNNPATGAAGHVFIEILGQWFESAGGVGIHQMTASEAQAYISSGLYKPFHPIGL